MFVFYRFLYGLRTATPFAIGLSGASTARFLIIDGLSWLVWLGFLGSLGYIFGETALAWLETIMVYQKWLLALFLVSLAVVIGTMVSKTQNR